ncbi:MAG: J domain-containing protein [Deltaproteobacteria bacterium]|nr:J domain-containing protein [Deltaproteobacteria bacterium]
MGSEARAEGVKDYYSILGVERGATATAIKAAYRRLARTHHPDYVIGESEELQAQASIRMAELNEAYDVLSNGEARREYDERWVTFSSGTFHVPSRHTAPITPEDLEVAATLEARSRPRATDRVTGSVVSAFAKRTCQELIEGRKGLAWRRADVEGFSWSLNASAWPLRFWIHLRSFDTLDPGSTERFIERGEEAVRASKRLVGRDLSLFVLAFYRIDEPDQVTAMCRRFRESALKSGAGSAEVNVALVDVVHGRSLPYGPPPSDGRFAEVIRHMGLNFGRNQHH